MAAQEAFLWVQDISNKSEILSCTCCGSCAIGTLGVQLAVYAKQATPAEALQNGYSPPHTFSAEESTSEAYLCELGCGSVYCSAACRTLDVDRYGHHYSCVGQCSDEDHPLYQFKMLAFTSGYYNEMMLAQKFLCYLLQAKEHKTQTPVTASWLQQSTEPWNSHSDDNDDPIAQTVTDSWQLLYTGIPLLHNYTDLTEEVWSKLLSVCVGRREEVSCSSGTPLVVFGEQLRKVPIQEQHSLAEPLVQALKARKEEREEQEDEEEEEVDEEEEKEEEGKPELTVERFIAEPHRYVCKLAGECVPLSLKLLTVEHSCVPTTTVCWELSDKGGGLQYKLKQREGCSEEEENQTLSVVDISLPLEERRDELTERGIPNCTCQRCLFELDNSSGEVSVVSLKRLLLLYQETQQLTEALAVTDEILRRDAQDLFALCQKCRILGWNDQFTEAYLLRKQIVQQFRNNTTSDISGEQREAYDKILNNFEEENVFVVSEGVQCMTKEENDAYFTKICVDSKPTKQLYVSKPDKPLLHPQLCNKIIQAAEAYATQHKGWSSSRHYAVPTTDLPVHEVGEIKDIFLKFLEEKLFSALGSQHDCLPSNIRVIDAFVVKYVAGAQNFLPVHTDQSQFSVTIALNSTDEYEGGGTWFVDLGYAVNCEAGGVVSFDGSLPHAGRSISQGVRYIIAAFLYAFDDSVGAIK